MSDLPQDDLQEGRVSAIRTQKKAPDRVSVFIEDDFAFGVHRDLLLEFNLAKGAMLTVDRQRKIVERDAYYRARALAFRYLSYRDRAADEIRRRLRRDDYTDNVIEDVVHDLQKSGYIDDDRFARDFAEGRFRTRGYGPVRIRSDLRRKGVSRASVDAAVEHVYSGRDEVLDRARDLGAKRWEQLSGEPDPLKRKKKVYDYLSRRGFAFDMVRRVVDELAAE